MVQSRFREAGSENETNAEIEIHIPRVFKEVGAAESVAGGGTCATVSGRAVIRFGGGLVALTVEVECDCGLDRGAEAAQRFDL